MDWSVVSGVALGLVAIVFIADKIISLVKDKTPPPAPVKSSKGNGSAQYSTCVGVTKDTVNQVAEMYYTRNDLAKSIDKLADGVSELNKGVTRFTAAQERSEERILSKIDGLKEI